ncbi:MAG: glycoside hydrolase family 15 protein [Candidatus Woesearchaeota archaeon]
MVLSYNQLLQQHLQTLKNLQYDSGLFAASSKSVGTGYDKSWLRDNFYECLAFEVIGDWQTVANTYKALLKIFEKHKDKIQWAIKNKPKERWQYIHARFDPQTFDEFWEEWGNKQNDAIGAILFKLGELYYHKENGKSFNILKTKEDIFMVQLLVDYLQAIEYWHDADSGMWEENEEIHASSVGACVAGLKRVAKIPGVHVLPSLIKHGELTLRKMLPRESDKKFVDLALLSLIYPYNVVTKKERELILENVEYHLLRKRGVIRYKNDYYYNKNPDGYSEEAEWTFGLSWLSIIHARLGNRKKAKHFEEMALATVNEKGEEPELYFSNTDEYNENSPLGWAESMLIVAVHELHDKHTENKKK